MLASAASVAATGTIVITDIASDAGTIHLYIAGDHIPVNIATTDSMDQIATAIGDAVNANFDLPVTATVATDTVTLTALWGGVSGNEINVSMNYYGTIGGEITPHDLGITLTVGGLLSGGVGVPDFTAALSHLGETPFEYIAMPYTDSNSLFDWNEEFGFTDTGRWGWERQLFGSHLLGQARSLCRSHHVRRDAEFRRHVDHVDRSAEPVAIVRVDGGVHREGATCFGQ